jgi:hypothetical protein
VSLIRCQRQVSHAAQKASVRRVRRTDYDELLDNADALLHP